MSLRTSLEASCALAHSTRKKKRKKVPRVSCSSRTSQWGVENAIPLLCGVDKASAISKTRKKHFAIRGHFQFGRNADARSTNGSALFLVKEGTTSRESVLQSEIQTKRASAECCMKFFTHLSSSRRLERKMRTGRSLQCLCAMQAFHLFYSFFVLSCTRFRTPLEITLIAHKYFYTDQIHQHCRRVVAITTMIEKLSESLYPKKAECSMMISILRFATSKSR